MGFWRYAASRALSMIPVLLGVSLATFALMHAVPGDPVRVFLGEASTAGPEAVEALRAQWGLDRPVYVQYLYYLWNALHGDLGRSIHTGRPVLQDLVARFPASVELALAGFAIALLAGIPLGALAGARPNSWMDHASRVGSLTFLSMPGFWFGLIVIYVGFYLLGLLPEPSGRLGLLEAPPPRVTGLFTVDSLLHGDFATFRAALSHLLAPAAVLSLPTFGLVVRMLRASVVEVLRSDYVRTARAKGVAPRRVLFKHVLKNALSPTVTVLGVQLGSLLGGNVLVETVFAWPGMGLYFVNSIQLLDYAPVTGATLVFASLLVLVNFLVDVSYAWLDPTVRYS
ncbi:MAG: ABC transporter permease [Bacillota bacterium]